MTKLLFFLLWSITSMISYDTRVLLVMLVCSLIIFAMSKTKWKQVGTVFKFIMFFDQFSIVEYLKYALSFTYSSTHPACKFDPLCRICLLVYGEALP